MIVLLYIFALFLVLFLTSIRLYRKNTGSILTKNDGISNLNLFLNNKVPLIKIFMISMILATYSAYLGVSGKLVDTTRYAWSFLYRYPQYYESVSTLVNSRTEPGFLIVNLIVSKFTDNPFWLFFVIAIITTYVNIYCLFKLNKKYLFLILIYLISIYYFQTTYILRQTIAVSFANLGFISLLKKNNKGYFIYSLIGLAFHSTALILFPLYFLYNRKDYKKTYVLILFVFLSMFFLFGPITNMILPRLPYINQYLNFENMGLTTGGGSFAAILKGIPYYIITILSLYKRKELKDSMYNADLFIIFSLLYSFSWLLTYNLYWSFRVGWYFLMPTIVLIPNLFKIIRSKRERIMYSFFIYSSMIIIIFRQIIITLI